MKLQRAYNNALPGGPSSDVNVIRPGFALGVLRDDDGKLFLTTFETTPIPAGTYRVTFCDHPIHGMAWQVQDVPGRTGILFHVGNTEADSEGCILLGFGFGWSGVAITNSIKAYQRFLRFLAARTEFTLTVADPA